MNFMFMLHPSGWSVLCTVAFFNIYFVYVLIFEKKFLLKNLHNADYICTFAFDIYIYSLICFFMEKIFIIKQYLSFNDGTKSEISVLSAFKDEKLAIDAASSYCRTYDGLYDVVCFVEPLSLF